MGVTMRTVLCVLLAFFMTGALYGETDKISEMNKRIEAEKQKQSDSSSDTASSDEDKTEVTGSPSSHHHHHDSDNNDDFDDWVARLMIEILFYCAQTSFYTQYSDFPYSDPEIAPYSTFIDDDVPTTYKFVNMNLYGEGAYYLDIYAARAVVRMNLSFLNVNANYTYYESLRNGNSFEAYSVHGGIILLNLPGFYLNSYFGVFKHTSSDLLFSWGFSATAFIGYGMNLDVFSRFSYSGDLPFINVTGMLNWSVDRLTFGIGYDYNLYANVPFGGPAVRMSVWF